MTITLAEVFDRHFQGVKFDNKLAAAVYKFQIGYVNSNSEHLQFFGGNLLGVQVIRFKDSDVLHFVEDIFNVDYVTLVEDIREVTTIDHDFKVSGDIFNLTTMYVIHRFLTEPALAKSVRDTAAYNVSLIFFYRCISALMNYYFRYPADEKIAQKAYANLSNKFLIKRLGSWIKVMEYRAKDMIDPNGLHRKTLEKFNDDSKVVYVLSDSQGRIRDLIKNYYAEFINVHTEGESIGISSSTIIGADGEESFKEKTKSADSYIAYARQLITDKRAFVRDDLIGVIARLNSNSSFRMIKHTVTWICDQYGNQKEHRTIDEFLGLVITQTMHLIEYNIAPTRRRDYAYVLNTLKNLYLSTRSVDPELEKIRDMGESIVLKANGKMSDSLKMATRTSIILYLSLRIMTGKEGKN